MTTNLFTKSKFVEELSPKDFDPKNVYKLKNDRCGIVLFYVPWCPYCRELATTSTNIGLWDKLGTAATFFDVYAFNCDENTTICNAIKAESPSFFKGWPTIIFYKNGFPVSRFNEKRTLENLIKECKKACN